MIKQYVLHTLPMQDHKMWAYLLPDFMLLGIFSVSFIIQTIIAFV